jgi:hypothetical protein
MLWSPNSPENGQNLYQRSGQWHLRFSGNELKIPFLKGELHSVAHPFPVGLVNLLEEWLWTWRPLLAAGATGSEHGNERSMNGQEFVFLNLRGGPLSGKQVTDSFQSATYRLTGIAVNPHMVPTIWATEYINATRNLIDAAYMLGDTVETVLKSYAKLLDQDCGKRASEWLAKTLGNEPPSRNGNGDVFHNKIANVLSMLKASLPEGNSDEQLLQSMKGSPKLK